MTSKDSKRMNIDTYNKSAKKIAEYFSGIGPRTRDIEIALEAYGDEAPRVLEIGCGDGRDAEDIIKMAGEYKGIDISKGLLEIAKDKNPEGDFEVADIEEYEFDKEYDIVFAFASLLHCDKSAVKSILKKLYKTMATGGIVYLSLKLADEYRVDKQSDKFGERMFYYYTPGLIKELAGDLYFTELVDTQHRLNPVKKSTDWFTIMLRTV